MTGNLFDDVKSNGLTPGKVSEGWYTAWCDGGSRGNPGPAGYGAVIEDPHGGTAARLSQFLGVHTNNYAEYQGLLGVLDWALANAVTRLRVVSDSELMVKQMKGQYKVASPGLRPLWEEAKRRAGKLERFEMRHTLRGGNVEADRLANAAMDRGTGKVASQLAVPGGSKNQPTNTAKQPQEPKKAPQQVLDGYVKDGVVHLLEGSLPEGAFVKIIKD